MKIALTILSTILLFTNSLFAQLDSIFNQGVYRTFIVHLPTGYSAANEYPLVLNLHGLNSSAVLQQTYTQFDNVANSEGLVVIYPDGINNSWTTIGNSDSDFLSNLVDTIRANYSINNCLFVTGMSQGGFMTYKFANTTSHNVTAIAVGSGNMSNALQNSSTSAPQIPVMHFHGTDDNLVSYDGTLLISSVENTIQWWVEHNNCNTTPVVTVMPDIDLTDNSTVEKYYYGNGTNDSEATFYKVINGGHTWSGAVPIPAFGVTNQDINQSEIIGNFFSDFCSTVLNAKILLQGPYDNSTGLMGDDLRGSSLPTAEPYAALGFPLVNSGSETFDNSLLSITGNDAIVDWVLVELRDKNDPTVLVATQSVLLQRDGDIVSTDGISPVSFRSIPADAYFISIAHRNHLRVTSAAPIDLSSTPTTLDFSNGTTPTAGNNAQVDLGNNVFALYAGDASSDGVIDAADRSETWNNRNQSGYLTADVNMDGVCDAADRSITWNNRNQGEQLP